MAATRAEIAEWFQEGVAQGYPRMIVWCDTFDYEDYPEFTYLTGMELHAHVTYNAGKNMKSLMEVYDLTASMGVQLNQRRVYNY